MSYRIVPITFQAPGINFLTYSLTLRYQVYLESGTQFAAVSRYNVMDFALLQLNGLAK